MNQKSSTVQISDVQHLGVVRDIQVFFEIDNIEHRDGGRKVITSCHIYHGPIILYSAEARQSYKDIHEQKKGRRAAFEKAMTQIYWANNISKVDRGRIWAAFLEVNTTAKSKPEIEK